jgi:hypothetical protein
MSKLVFKTVQFIKRECEESWKRDHNKVMANYKAADCLGDAAQLYLSLFVQLKAATEDTDNESFDSVLSLCETLDLWYEATSSLLAKIDGLEGDDFPVESADKVRRCHRDAAMLLEDLHDAKNAIEAVQGGTSIGLEDFLDELRHPVHR